MQVGGNNSLGEFFSSYDLMSEPMDVRYQTKAAEYYRKKLRAFANEEEFHEEKPDYEMGRSPIEYRVKTQEELKEAIGGGANKENVDGIDKAKLIMQEFWANTKNAASKGYNYTKEGVKKAGGKLEESGVTAKVKSGAQVVGSKTVEYGGIAYNKTKEGISKIASNEKVQEYSSKAYNGARDAGNAVWGFFAKALNKNNNNGADEHIDEGNDDDGFTDLHPSANQPSPGGSNNPDFSPGT